MSFKTDYQKYTVETIKRSEIKNAPYNPRFITREAKERLSASLAEHGLVEPVIWNKTTGHLVGGHQRIEVLDMLEGNQEYELDVSVIEVPEREEALLNVQLNNSNLQGNWDIDKLADLKMDFDFSFDEMGFDDLDVAFMFDGDERFCELYETPEVNEEKQKIRDIREARKEGEENMAERNNINFYSILVFANEDAKKEFYKRISMPIAEEVLTVEIIERILQEKK